MNVADLVIGVILLVGFLTGIARGFVRQLLGLVGLFLGIMIAAGNYERLAREYLSFIPGDRAAAIVSFVLIFLVIIVLVAVVAKIIARALRVAALGWLDRLAGAVLGVVIAGIVAGVILLLAVMAGLEGEKVIVESRLAPRVIGATDVVVSLLPEQVAQTVDQQYAKLREEWESARAASEDEEQQKGESEGESAEGPA